MMRTLRRFVHERDAGPIVEFAVVVPVLLLLLFGIVDFAQAFFQRNSLVSIAREGARYAAANKFPCATATSDTVKARGVRQFEKGVGAALSASSIVLTCTGSPVTTVAVQIQNYPFTPITPLFRLLGGNKSIQLNAKAVYRWERAE